MEVWEFTSLHSANESCGMAWPEGVAVRGGDICFKVLFKGRRRRTWRSRKYKDSPGGNQGRIALLPTNLHHGDLGPS